jgi:hypothetical protein
MQREWKKIEEYPAYEISNYGEIKSAYKLGEEKQIGVDGSGYKLTLLFYKGKRLTVRVHTLVLEAFLSKAGPNMVANHKDGNKLNNRSDNLEWITKSQNLQHAYDAGLREQKKDGSQETCRSVLQCDYQGNILNEYPGVRFAERATGIKAISMCIHKRKGRAGGYLWKFKE